jgi:hypothetical protein
MEEKNDNKEENFIKDGVIEIDPFKDPILIKTPANKSDTVNEYFSRRFSVEEAADTLSKIEGKLLLVNKQLNPNYDDKKNFAFQMSMAARNLTMRFYKRRDPSAPDDEPLGDFPIKKD